MNLLSRDEAFLTGQIKYFTGRSCANGHISPRYTKNTNCVECNRLANNKAQIRVRAQFASGSEIVTVCRELAELSKHIGVAKLLVEYEASTPNSPELMELRKIRDGMKELVKDYEFRASAGLLEV